MTDIPPGAADPVGLASSLMQSAEATHDFAARAARSRKDKRRLERLRTATQEHLALVGPHVASLLENDEPTGFLAPTFVRSVSSDGRSLLLPGLVLVLADRVIFSWKDATGTQSVIEDSIVPLNSITDCRAGLSEGIRGWELLEVQAAKEWYSFFPPDWAIPGLPLSTMLRKLIKGHWRPLYHEDTGPTGPIIALEELDS